jgi:hypothetical protein
VQSLKVTKGTEIKGRMPPNGKGDGDQDHDQDLNSEDEETVDDMIKELLSLEEESESASHPLIRALYHAVNLSFFCI